jgi:CubicO group peptidase (beta-lactamase class C family)
MSASVFYPGQGVWTGTSGLSYSGQPITSDMEFGIASNTKLFTAVAIVKLVENNILNLNDQLDKWLPNYENIDSTITIRQLLNHTSGVADIFSPSTMAYIDSNPTHLFTIAELMALVGTKIFDPGASFSYSNTNYILAGMVAESATGIHISRIIRDSILTPLRLDSTFFDVREAVLGIKAHPWQNGADVNSTSRVALNSAGGSAGAMYSTAGEMVQWYNALFSGQIINANSLAQLTTFLPPGNYGFGLTTMLMFGRTLWGHGGSHTGYKSRMFYDPEMKASVCGLSNSFPSAVDGITAMLYKVLLDNLPAVAGTISGTNIICQGLNSITYTVPTIANATSYIWTLPSGATGTSNTNSITVDYNSTSLSGNITVRGSNSYGDGAVSTLKITVIPLPLSAGAISGPTTVCRGDNSINYTVPTIPNAIFYIWTLPGGAIGTSATNSITVKYDSLSISGNISVMGRNTCGSGTASTLAVTVNQLPSNSTAISGISSVCQGQKAVTYTVPTIANATSYIWTLPNGAKGMSLTNSIAVDFGDSAVSGDITINGRNSCGEGTSSALHISVNPLPSSAGSITGATIICQGETSVKYIVPSIENASQYSWTLPNGATGSSTTNIITVDYSTSAISGNITVNGNNACGNGASSTLSVIINKKPSTPAISLNGTILTSDATNGNQWYNQSGLIDGATNQTYTVTSDGTYFDIVTLSECISDTSNKIKVLLSGVETIEKDINYQFYPNPAITNIFVKSSNENQVKYDILNIIGQTLQSGMICNGSIDVSKLENGIYYLKIANKFNKFMVVR